MARVGVDLDGVVVDFVDSYRKHCRMHSDMGSMPEPTSWEFYKDASWGSQSTEYFQSCLREFDAIFAQAKPYPGAIKALKGLFDAGHTLVFITDRGINPRAMDITMEWLERHGLWFDNAELHITADKASILPPVDYFIDDKPENVRSMPRVKTFLCDRPWNDEAVLAPGTHRGTLEQFVEKVLEREQGQSVLAMQRMLNLNLLSDMKQPTEVRVTSATGGEKGQKQARIGSIDPLALMEMAKVAGFGEQKYARLNYLNGYDWSLSYDACQRHLNAFWSGEDLDPESGLPHLAHAGWHCMAMLAFMIHQLGTDDRFKKAAA